MKDDAAAEQEKQALIVRKYIEKVLVEAGIDDPDSVKSEEGLIWFLNDGEIDFHIEIIQFTDQEEQPVTILEIGGIIEEHLPTGSKQVNMFRNTAYLNGEMVGGYFAIREEMLLVLTTRSIEEVTEPLLKNLLEDISSLTRYWQTNKEELFK